jgi:integrase/recombinase XerD
MSTPTITIFVRHSATCKYAGDEFCKRCSCRKHLRWSQGRRQYRRASGTRSWEQAEVKKRELEDQLAGRLPSPSELNKPKLITEALEEFLQQKTVQGIKKEPYRREIGRLQDFLNLKGVFVVQRITRELLIEYMTTWPDLYPSSNTRGIVRARLRCFLRYLYQSQWLPRVPDLPRIKSDSPPTLPLTDDEYKRVTEGPRTDPIDASLGFGCR